MTKYPRFRIAAITALALALLIAVGHRARAEEPVTVFAAASMTDVLNRLGERYQAQTGTPIRFAFASSSTLARQIEAGAPADIFVSANVTWMDALRAKGLIDEASLVTPIGNALVLIAPAEAKRDYVIMEPGVDLAGMLGADGRLAVGEPSSVPAGIYARQALESLGAWDDVADRLAPAADVRAALALVARGEAPFGIVYATDAVVSADVDIVGRFPPQSHDPILYPFAIVAGRDSDAVRQVFDFLTGPDAGPVYESYGFALADRPDTERAR
jgi:molybdate transport system substrate-binding protein